MASQDILGIILARGGSKRIPQKNIVPVNGKPLLAYTCEAALGSSLLTRTILSTDDEAIAAVGRTCGVDAPFLRPKELARDETPSMDAVRHVLSELERREAYKPPIVVVLQPTSPLRTSTHIDDALSLFLETSPDSVVSVTAMPYAHGPQMSMRIESGKLVPAPESRIPQERVMFYALNGAVYVLKTDNVRSGGNVFGADSRALVMDPESSLDIDTPVDLACAEFLLRGRKAH